MSDKKLILDLCGGTGSWSEPYRKDSDYEVINVTLPDYNVIDYEYPDRAGVYGVLAAPPCNKMSKANRNMASLSELKYSFIVASCCIAFVAYYNPKFWALENPAGSKISVLLGEPKYKFYHWQYAGNVSKYTYLWGNFNIPIKLYDLKPLNLEKIENISGFKNRAITPSKFAEQFYNSNK